MPLGRAQKRIDALIERDGPFCIWCQRDTRERFVRPSVEHVIPRVKGGPTWDENLVLACKRCNHERKHATLGGWADECESRGWEPDIGRLIESLEAVEARIQVEGGQRCARPWLTSQLNRLRKRHGR